ncbi:MAG: cell division protein ZapA [Clostridia bacterium]|nr:cell division protein ZapA [Clostridia bacterium]
MGKNKISISVAGSEFVVTTDEEREYTLELARTVDGKIRSLLENTKLTVNLAAILTALDLCDENEKNKRSCARLREEIRLYLAQVEAQPRLQEELEHLKQENKLLREQIAQYEAGQIGFGS